MSAGAPPQTPLQHTSLPKPRAVFKGLLLRGGRAREGGEGKVGRREKGREGKKKEERGREGGEEREGKVKGSAGPM